MFLPNHEFVVTAAVDVIRVCRSEDIVGNVGSDVVRGVIRPLHARWHAPGSLDRNALRKLTPGIDVTLDIILCSLPRPFAAPPNTISGGALEIRALRS